MTSIPQSNNQGAVFELIARGQKDKFFLNESSSSKWAFNNAYKSSVPFVSERRTIVPLNAPHFGNTFEIEIDKYGDILTECTLLIDLPTWFPPLALVPGGPTIDPKIVNDRFSINTNISYDGYGYTNFIGYYLFDSIQFYQDQNLIQEWSGESLFATQITEGSWNSSFLDQKNAGAFQTLDYTALRRNATPGQLRIKLPLPGIQAPNDGGFPLCCAPSQVYRLRIRLRQLEDLVVSSNINMIKPAPWNEPLFVYSTLLYDQITFKPLTRDQIGQPTIVLETVQAYVKDNIQSALQTRLVTIPFRKVYQNIFTIGELDYKPLDLMGGGAATISRQLDARHIGERLIYMFRTGENLDKNRLYDLYNRLDIGGSFYSGMKLVIAGQDREFYFEDFLWKDIQALVKDERDNNWGIGEMRWNLGDIYGSERPAPRQPEGGVNFSTADRPTLYIQLKNVPIQQTLEQRRTELRIFIESWAVYEFQEGRGRLVFGA